MEVIYSEVALKDIEYWKRLGNKTVQRKIQQLITGIIQDPQHGIGKPEPLKHNYSGLWSRRIDREHRIVYKVE